jgi:hypothetical protein
LTLGGGGAAPKASAPTGAGPPADPRLERIRNHLRRYKELAGQGKWAEGGKEVEAIEGELK